MDIQKNIPAVSRINPPVVSIVLNAHTPFLGLIKQSKNAAENTYLEHCFFNAVSETYIPLLAMFDRLDRDRVPFRMGICLSPVLCRMLCDEALIKRYLEYTDKQIEFAFKELKNSREDEKLREPVKYFYDQIVEKRILFTERYDTDIVKVFDNYQQKGRLELLGTAATHAFLPFYVSYPEAIQAEIETAMGAYRSYFGRYPLGFWLPEFGWTGELDSWLRSYNAVYTMVDTHGLVLSRPEAEKGAFYPAITPSGVFILGRDFYAGEDIESLSVDPVYRDNRKDMGFELSTEKLSAFLDEEGGRSETGFKCWNWGGGIYDPLSAASRAEEHAELFLKNSACRLEPVAARLNAPPVCLCAFEADTFGRRWYEGPHFLETLFRKAAGHDGSRAGSAEIQFMSPADYLFRLDSRSFQKVIPEFSSSGENGYAETWVDSSSSWMYCHTMRALERMTEISERFSDNSGLKERVLNQAAREILLLLSSDWPKMLYRQECTEYARNQIESYLRNFTTIYEALGSNCISTEWLTLLERKHNIFPQINYRVFRQKKGQTGKFVP
ncbi:MAG: DUF1957 domain-containing protein [Treponema sp.]|jgi:1,4-alpha-glucan branching enzyme|nr:DUF1957 domain-containing protein [Treponema sp.]